MELSLLQKKKYLTTRIALKRTLFSSLMLSCLCCCLNASPSAFKIIGRLDVNCPNASTEYGVSWDSGKAAELDTSYEWRWQVNGGKFSNGKIEYVQSGNEHPKSQVAWLNYSNYAGKISLSLYHDSELLYSTSEWVRIGQFAPAGIQIEDGVLSCEGNWFVLKSEVPFSGGETIEWTITNGLDINNKPMQTISKQGKDASRLYIVLADQTKPLIVSVRVKSDCGNATRNTKPVLQEFEYPKIRLSGKEIVDEGSSSSFAVCYASGQGHGKKPLIWHSTGIIKSQSESAVTVQFSEAGTQVVSMTYEDCSGMVKTATRYVKVMPKNPVGQDQSRLLNGKKSRNTIGCRVFPNPVSGGVLNIEVTVAEIGQLEFVNLQGKVILRKEITSELTTLETFGYPMGIYLIRVVTPSGEYSTKVNLN